MHAPRFCTPGTHLWTPDVTKPSLVVPPRTWSEIQCRAIQLTVFRQFHLAFMAIGLGMLFYTLMLNLTFRLRIISTSVVPTVSLGPN